VVEKWLASAHMADGQKFDLSSSDDGCLNVAGKVILLILEGCLAPRLDPSL